MTDQITDKTITVDGKQYEVENLTDQQREMLNLHRRFSDDVRELRIQLAQAELAREFLGIKIANAVKLSDPDLQNAEAPTPANEPTQEAGE